MAKGNGRLRLIGLIVTLVVLLAGVVATWAIYGEDIEDNTADIVKLEKDGYAVADTNKFDIALIQKDIETIQRTQKDMRREQRKGFEEILKRLPQ